jgi:hypothetical protein
MPHAIEIFQINAYNCIIAQVSSTLEVGAPHGLILYGFG